MSEIACVCVLGAASVIPYPLRVVGFVPAVTWPCAFTVTLLYVPAVTPELGCVYTVSVAEIVILSFVASGVIVTFVPATNVSVSVAVSAEIVVLPTVTLLNAFWFFSAFDGAWAAWEWV